MFGRDNAPLGVILIKHGEDKMVRFWEAFEACPLQMALLPIYNDEYDSIKLSFYIKAILLCPRQGDIYESLKAIIWSNL